MWIETLGYLQEGIYIRKVKYLSLFIFIFLKKESKTIVSLEWDERIFFFLIFIEKHIHSLTVQEFLHFFFLRKCSFNINTIAGKKNQRD